MPIPGERSRICRMVSAKMPRPPSGRSSRATLVTTTCSSCMAATATRDAARLVVIEPGRPAGLDRAEAARPGAGVAQDHDRRGALVPALPDVRAVGLLADRVQVEAAEQALEVVVVLARWHPRPDPVGMAALRDGAVRRGQAGQAAADRDRQVGPIVRGTVGRCRLEHRELASHGRSVARSPSGGGPAVRPSEAAADRGRSPVAVACRGRAGTSPRRRARTTPGEASRSPRGAGWPSGRRGCRRDRTTWHPGRAPSRRGRAPGPAGRAARRGTGNSSLVGANQPGAATSTARADVRTSRMIGVIGPSMAAAGRSQPASTVPSAAARTATAGTRRGRRAGGVVRPSAIAEGGTDPAGQVARACIRAPPLPWPRTPSRSRPGRDRRTSRRSSGKPARRASQAGAREPRRMSATGSSKRGRPCRRPRRHRHGIAQAHVLAGQDVRLADPSAIQAADDPGGDVIDEDRRDARRAQGDVAGRAVVRAASCGADGRVIARTVGHAGHDDDDRRPGGDALLRRPDGPRNFVSS